MALDHRGEGGRADDVSLEQPAAATDGIRRVGAGGISGTVTFLFTDIEGSTRLLRNLGRARYGEVLAEHGAVLRAAFGEYGGEVIDTQGDAFFVAFRSAADAIGAAAASQRALHTHEWAEPASISVRMGLHTGEAALANDRYLGLAVHLAARIGSAAHGGQVLLSEVTRVLVEDELPTDIGLRDLGEQRLKDIERPVRIHQLDVAGLPAAFPPLRTGETAFSGREDELAAEAGAALRRRPHIRTAIAAAAVVAVAVAVALVALTRGGSGVAVAADSIAAIDPKTNKVVADIGGVGKDPSVIVAGDGAIWVGSSHDQTVTRINPKTRRVTAVVGLGASPSYIAVGRGSVWVSTGKTGTVVPIDPADNKAGTAITLRRASTLRPSAEGVDVAQDGVWVYDSGQLTLQRIDPGTRIVDKVIPPGTGAAAMNQPTPIIVRDGKLLYLCCGIYAGSPAVARADLQAESPAVPTSLDQVPSAMAFGAGLLWVTLHNELDHLDATFSTPSAISLGSHSRLTGVTVASRAVWAGDAGTRKVWRIDASSFTKRASIPLNGHAPNGIAAGNGLVWVSVGS